jgi:glycosyltransferase involved in cell wall biosynthesis
MKNILIWVTTFPEFSETFIRDHICGLIDRKYDVTIFTGNRETANRSALNGFERYDLMKKTITFKDIVPHSKIRRLLAAITILSGALANGSIAPLLRSLNVGSLGKKALTLNLFFLTHYIMSRKIGVVHAHYGPNGVEAVAIKQILPTIRLITTFHGYDIRLGNELGGGMYAGLFEAADKLVAISRYNHRSLIELGAARSKIAEVPNGVFLTHLLAIQRSSHQSPHNGIRILSVGRLVKEKGYGLILQSIQQVKQRRPELHLTYSIVGEGEQRPEIEGMIHNLDLTGQVILHGQKSSQEVCRLMAENDVYLLGSIAEALPTVVIEAQAAAMPVIATNVGSVPDMLENYKAGIIVEADQVDELVRGIEYMLDHRDEWLNMGQWGRRFAQSTFSVEHSIARLDAIYSQPVPASN